MDVFNLNSLKGLLHSKTPFGSPLRQSAAAPLPAVDYDAGAPILAHFQSAWEELHQINEDNASKAASLAAEIRAVEDGVIARKDGLEKISALLSETGHIRENAENCARQVGELYGGFERLERALVDLEDLIERCELVGVKRDHMAQLAAYKEKKLRGLDTLRLELASKHAQNLMDEEMKKRRELEERQSAFQDAFQNDLETFKALGTIPKIEIKKQQPSALLEEITLDVDEDELNRFLEEK